MSKIVPLELQRTESAGLRIRWSDGTLRHYPVRTLRDNCPCATCREKRMNESPKQPDPLMILSPAEARPLALASMRPVGQYAYKIGFSDEHDTGIFPLEFLYELGEPVSEGV